MMAMNRVNAIGLQYRLTEVMGEPDKTAIKMGGKQIIVNANIHAISQAWYNWQQRGMFIQDAFPFFSSSEREFLMTGITEAEWNETFKEEEN
jgi:hypothetical protein